MKLTYEQFEEVIEVLEFYANDRNHDEKYRNLWNSDYYQSEVMLDNGEKARNLLEILTKEEESTNIKIIKNNCSTADKCILKIDGKYFGYNNHPQHSESTFKNIKNAYIFKNQHEALSITTWYSGSEFELLPKLF